VQGRIFAATVVVALSAVPMVRATPQNVQEINEIRRILREASHLIGDIEEAQQASATANIASAQARAGDLQGAFATAYALPKRSDQAGAGQHCLGACPYRRSTLRSAADRHF
jgi:hypothetical protein